jgi:hypothetical protein
MLSPFVVCVGLVMLLTGLYLLSRGLGGAGLALAVLRTPQATVAAAIDSGEQSFVRGTAAATGSTLVGPFSGREALVVGYEVRELRY